MKRCFYRWGFLLSVLSLRLMADGPVFNYGNAAEPKDLDPHTVTGVPESHILMNIFEGLVNKDPKTLVPIPGVAESWKISKDGKTYTFKIRKSAKWSNGEPVTAEDFIYSWTRLLTPSTAAEYAQMGYPIKNGKDFATGKLADVSKLGMRAPDPHTFVVELEHPVPYFLSLVFHHSLYPVPKKVIEKYGAKWTRPGNMVSNGAFMLTKWEMNKVITINRNPHYWDASTVSLAQVNFYPAQRETEEKMFRSKELHVTDDIPPEKATFWMKDTSGVFRKDPYLGVYFYWMNTQKAPLDNKLVRKALALAIDRTKLVEKVTQLNEPPATAFTPPGTGGYQPTPRLPKDGSGIAKARELLKQAGYPGGKGLAPIEILYNNDSKHKKVAEAIQAMLKENLGVDLKLYNQEWKVYLDSQRTGNFQLSRAGWIGDYNDPNTFLDMFVTGSELNHAHYSNPEYDKLIAAAARELNAKKRLQIFQKAEDILLEDMPVLPIYVYVKVRLLQPEVAGWHPNIEDVHQLKFVSLRNGAR